jgi:pimeloyl-ACP methyl ester carboxylesterase
MVSAEQAVSSELTPFRIAIPQEELDDLQRRLESARLPGHPPGSGWDEGIEPATLERLLDRWRDGFDWRAVEARFNEDEHVTAEIDGGQVHAVVVRSERQDAIPLMLLHGWPSTFAEFMWVARGLASPESSDQPAFHVVIPSLPGFGFSGRPDEPTWSASRTAEAMVELMRRLGFSGYIASGGDIGMGVAQSMAQVDGAPMRGIHLCLGGVSQAGRRQGEESRTPAEADRKERQRTYMDRKSGYAQLQRTRPQTVAYLLTDSPVAQLAWIGEKFHEWTDPDHPVSDDDILIAASIYWFTRTGGSAARWYAQGGGPGKAPKPEITLPTGVSSWPHDIVPALREWTEQEYDLVYWADMPAGAHFPALEVPEVLTETLQSFVRALGQGARR